MIAFASSEAQQNERRVALTPRAVERLVRLGIEVRVGAGIGAGIHLGDDAYRDAGAEIRDDVGAAVAEADALLRVSPPPLELVERLRPGAAVVSFLDPFRTPELVRALARRRIDALCMELIPRSSYAQKMDALSSQASLAGYAAVIRAAERSSKVLPMMTTPSGTIAPARVFVIGVGVAGLQAIATAKRLGARVEAYDTRPVVAEQVQSLGAKFVRIDVGETGETAQGYAKALTDEQLAEQRRQMARHVAEADIVVTTAQLFGRPAPRIVDADMLGGMRPGSVVVDLAAATGGNVEGSVADREVEIGGVRLIGLASAPAEVAVDASQMYANNVVNLLEHAWDAEAKALRLEPDDEVIGACLLTRDGAIRHDGVRERVEAAPAEEEA